VTCVNCSQVKVEFSDIIAFDKEGKEDIWHMTFLIERYLATHPTENYKTVELALRTNECATRLIGGIPNPQIKIPLLFRGEKQSYAICIAMGRSASVTEKFLKILAGNQETNLERLEKAGQYVFNDPEEILQTLSSPPSAESSGTS
jgi:hypothetical protein